VTDDFKKGFFTTLVILKDYIPDIVIVGGWAPFIYYHYLLPNKNLNPLRTKDIDIVVPPKLKKIADKTIDELLITAGLMPNFKSLHTPPVIHYEGNIEIDLIISQRPETAFPNMNEEQFKHYVVGVFQEFMNKISSVPE